MTRPRPPGWIAIVPVAFALGGIIVVMAFALLLSTLACAQEPPAKCLPRDALLRHLKKAFAETPVAWGVASERSIMELLRAEDGSWSLVVTMSNGASCLIGTGSGWENAPAPIPGEPL